MKQPIFIVVILLISLSSCKSKKAIAFKAFIHQKERGAFDILTSPGGPEVVKLNCLIKKDFKGALQATDKQEQAFNQLIKEIATLPADDIKQGPAVKTAAISFYTALRDLHIGDRQEIMAQEAAYDKDTAVVRKAQDKLIKLNEEKLSMFDTVNKKNEVLHDALEKFNKENNL